MEMVKKKERQGETQFTKKIDSFLNYPLTPPPPFYVNVFFLIFTLFMTKLKVLMLCFPYIIHNSTIP
jgi:hypothetical protein